MSAILGIGAPIVDHIVLVDEAFIQSIDGEKGGMELVDRKTFQKLLKAAEKQPVMIAGGSGTNTIKGLANFGHSCSMTGMLGSDEPSKLVLDSITKLGITPLYLRSDTPTGASLCMITPDNQRTLRTFPGAVSEMTGKDLNPEWFQGKALVHLEGYTLLNEGLAETAMQLAKEAGAEVSFDLASFEIATRYKEKIVHHLVRHVDILFANADETKTFTGRSPEKGCDILKDMAGTVVVFLGDQGGWVARGDEKVRYPAFKASPLDTTGAGDLFASGFLHGILSGYPLEHCAALGAQTGSAVVEVYGAEIPPELWAQIKSRTTLHRAT